MTVCFVRGRSESDQSLRLDPHRPGLNLTTDFHRLATRQSALSVTQLAEQQKNCPAPLACLPNSADRFARMDARPR